MSLNYTHIHGEYRVFLCSVWNVITCDQDMVTPSEVFRE